MNKIWLFRSILLTLLAFLLFWDVMMCLGHDLPSLEHRDFLLAGALLWIASMFFPQKRDDDWQLT